MKLFRSTDPQYPDGEQVRDFVFRRRLRETISSGCGGTRRRAGCTTPARARRARSLIWRTPCSPHSGSRRGSPFIDMPADLARQYQNFTRAEMSKLRAAGCGISATVLEGGVCDTVRWLEGGAGVRAAA